MLKTYIMFIGNLGSYKSWQEKTNDIIESRDISNIRREALKRGEVVTEVNAEELAPEVEMVSFYCFVLL